MDYSKMKLGLIGRFKVWNQRRIAEAQRNQYYKDEGELLEVDYSEADKLQADLLEQKRIKKATRDATKLYKSVYGKDNDGVGESDFIEDYLVEHGLKQKALPEPETPKKHSFMEQYPTEKSEEELAYEKANTETKFYYRIGDKEYELPPKFAQYVSNQNNLNDDIVIPLEDRGNGKYVVLDDGMEGYRKTEMLTYLIDSSIKEQAFDLEFNEPDEDVHEEFAKMSRMASAKKWLADKLIAEGKEDEANEGLKKKLGEILQFRDNRLKSEQETERD